MDLHAVQVGFLTQDDLERDHHHSVPVDEFVRQIAGGIDHYSNTVSSLVQLTVLLAHVIRFGRLDDAPLSSELKDLIRRVGVDVNLEDVLGPEQHDRATQLPQLRPDLRRRREAGAAYQDFGAELVVALGNHLGQGRGVRDVVRHRLHGSQYRVSLDEANDSLQHPHKRLGPGVHDAGFLEDAEEVRRPHQGGVCLLEHATHQLLEVLRLPRRTFGFLGGVPGDGENRSLHRLVERFVQPVGAGTDCPGHVFGGCGFSAF